MKLLDKIWSLLGLVETEESEDMQQGAADKSVARLERKAERPARSSEESKSRRLSQAETNSAVPNVSLPVRSNTAGLPVPNDSGENRGTVVITQPKNFDDARQIAENLTNGRTVFVNFEKTDADTIKRTVDFMSGITYAVGGTVQRISSEIFLFAPSLVEVVANERFAEGEQDALPWRRS